MGMENIHGQMAMFIKVILKTIIVMVKEQKFTQMVMLEKVNGLTMFIRPMTSMKNKEESSKKDSYSSGDKVFPAASGTAFSISKMDT